MIKVAIVGITGYTGIETARLVIRHPNMELTYAASQSYAGKTLCEVYPHLSGFSDIVLEPLSIEKILESSDLAIVALPHGASMQCCGELVKAGLKVVDLSADFRYDDLAVYEKTYQLKHECPSINSSSVYGLPELYRERIVNAPLTANPGCYPTCALLGMAPLLANKRIVRDDIIIDAASGVSGAGRNTDLPYQYCEAAENFSAYKIASHRHVSEIEEKSSELFEQPVKVTFTPHLAPMKRGMMTTIYAKPTETITAKDLYDLYVRFYRDEPFVRVSPSGIAPQTKAVVGSNFTDVGVFLDERSNRIIVVSVIDNLGKGAAWQAIQNANLMMGIEETSGLMVPGLYL